MDKLIKQKQKQIEKLKLLSSYKKKEDLILKKLRQIKSQKSRVSKKTSSKSSSKSVVKSSSKSGLPTGLIYTGAGIASLIAIYRLYKLWKDNSVTPKVEDVDDMETP
jgi:hypothetical protein